MASPGTTSISIDVSARKVPKKRSVLEGDALGRFNDALRCGVGSTTVLFYFELLCVFPNTKKINVFTVTEASFSLHIFIVE